MSKQYDLVVFIGRFQPFHLGHKKTLEKALELGRKVHVLIGSADTPRDIRNPFTYTERWATILSNIPEEILSHERITISPITDETYNDDLWCDNVRRIVQSEKVSGKVAIIGSERDKSLGYADLFPEWNLIPGADYIPGINATNIREMYFGDGIIDEEWLPEKTVAFLREFQYNTGSHGKAVSKSYKELADEFRYVREYKRMWKSQGTEFYGGPIHHTVDAVVLCKGHTLLVKRRSHPGKGTYAFPGGYVNQGEKIIDSMIRELKEETKINVPPGKLRGSIINKETFDDPDRSVRGRVITNAFLIHLSDEEGLPKVKGDSDAESAVWVPLNKFYDMRDTLFEDHYHIGKYFFRGR